ncbi:MAG: hypothetical protein R2697_00010 [Ilumatobacteraceae bacterium]
MPDLIAIGYDDTTTAPRLIPAASRQNDGRPAQLVGRAPSRAGSGV